MKNPYSKSIMTDLIMDKSEHSIVRHEAILAFADLHGETQEILQLRDDPEQLVAESAFIILN